MRNALVMLILGASIALPAAAFAAESGTDNHPDYRGPGAPPQLILRTGPATLGKIAGPSQEIPWWLQTRSEVSGPRDR